MHHLKPLVEWETGSTYPDITLLPIIADFFGVSIDDLLGSSQDKIKARVRLLYV